MCELAQQWYWYGNNGNGIELEALRPQHKRAEKQLKICSNIEKQIGFRFRLPANNAARKWEFY